MEKYICKFLPPTAGYGFFVGNYFITAGHIITNYDKKIIVFNNIEYDLSDMEPLYYSDNLKYDAGIDLAVYKFANINSTLKICNHVPRIGDRVNIILKSFPPPKLFSKELKFNIQKITAIVNEAHSENYFGGETDILLYPGESGSPIFFNNEIIGVLCAGNNDNGIKVKNKYPINFCAFLKSQKLENILKNLLVKDYNRIYDQQQMLLVCKKSDFENDTIEDKLFLVYKDEWENDEKSEENTFDLLMTTIKNNTINLYTIHAPEYSEVDAVVIADSLPYFRKDDYMEI